MCEYVLALCPAPIPTYVFSQGKTIPIPINDIGVRLPPSKIDKECVAASSAVPWGHLTADSSKAESKLARHADGGLWDGHLSHTSINTYFASQISRGARAPLASLRSCHPNGLGELLPPAK